MVGKILTPTTFLALFKTTFIGFKTYDQAIAGMTDREIVKIQDFSENYTCLLS